MPRLCGPAGLKVCRSDVVELMEMHALLGRAVDIVLELAVAVRNATRCKLAGQRDLMNATDRSTACAVDAHSCEPACGTPVHLPLTADLPDLPPYLSTGQGHREYR